LGQAEGVEALPVREKTAETGKKASQPKEETGRLWDQKTKGQSTGSAPNLCGALIKLVSICQAENSQKPKVGVKNAIRRGLGLDHRSGHSQQRDNRKMFLALLFERTINGVSP